MPQWFTNESRVWTTDEIAALKVLKEQKTPLHIMRTVLGRSAGSIQGQVQKQNAATSQQKISTRIEI